MNGVQDLRGTVWDEVGGFDLASLMPNIELLSAGLEDLFVATEAKPMRTRGSAGARKTGPVVLDMRRTHAVSIGIANIKLPAGEVAARLRRLDARSLSLEQLESLLGVLPTDDELRSLQAYVDRYDGDTSELSLPEQYLLQLGSATKPLRAVHVCMTLHTFAADARGVRAAADLVRSACEEIMGSVRLTKLLGLILAVGNAMNSGTSYGDARGFFIDSLLRMASVKASNTDKRNLSLLHYTVSAIYAQDPGALDLPEELPSLDKAANVEFDQQITFALRDLRSAVRRVQSATPALELPAFETRYPYLHDVGAQRARLAVRLTCAATVHLVVTESHAGPFHANGSAPSPGGAPAAPAGSLLRRQSTTNALLHTAHSPASSSASSSGGGTPNTASRGAPSPCEPSPSSSAGVLGSPAGVSLSDQAALLGVSADGVRRGVVPAGCGAVVHTRSLQAHGGFTYFVEVGGLLPGRRYTAFLALEDSFETWPPDGPREVELCRKPIHFHTLAHGQACAADGTVARGASTSAQAEAIEEEEGEEGDAGEGAGGASADFAGKLSAMLAKRGGGPAGAPGKPLKLRRRPATIVPLAAGAAVERRSSDPGNGFAEQLANGAASEADGGALDEDEAEQPPPEGPPVKRPGEDADAAAARAQVFGFLKRAEPELRALEALESGVRAKLLELGRYFGEPKSNAIEVFGVLVTLKDFLAEFKKVKLSVLEQRKVQERLAAQEQRINRRRTVG